MCDLIRILVLAVVFGTLPGCGGPAPAEGGTPGKLTFGSDVSSDIQITVHQRVSGGFQELGFGNTSADGSFILYKSGAKEPLWLEPGDYRFTLESIGPPVQFPEELQEPNSTPLKVTWTSDMTSLLLDLPRELIAQE